MKRRGFGLMMALGLGSLFFVLGMVVLAQLEAVRHRLTDHTFNLEARSMAASGCRYARAMLDHHRWNPPTRFQSRDFPGGGSFLVEVRRTASGWQIVAEGRAGWRRFQHLEAYP